VQRHLTKRLRLQLLLLARSEAVRSHECRGADGQPVTLSEHEGSLRASPPFVEHFDRDPDNSSVAGAAAAAAAAAAAGEEKEEKEEEEDGEEPPHL
jgi:hypothetical protein